jgi:glucose/arabinose dehydrogenase
MKPVRNGLALIVLLIAAVPIYFLGSGAVGVSSFPVMLNMMTGRSAKLPAESTRGARFKLPEGFSLSLYAQDLPNARFLRFTGRGDLLVSRPRHGDIVLLRPDPADPAIAGERLTILEGLKGPSGLDLVEGWLYVGESNAIGRVPFDPDSGTTSGEYRKIITGLTDNGNHPYKPIAIGPDNKLYLSQGSSCNVCLEQDPRRGSISRFNLDGTGEELIATGLRNSMGMAWAPWSGSLYATDNGRDMLGDDYPPCELNRIETGSFYGWPYFNGANEADPDYPGAPQQLADRAVAPVFDFRAHNAPLGLNFPDTSNWPSEYDKVALVALHGSWNRSTPDGYRVVSLHWVNGTIQSRDFLSGFELDGDIIGRPVDVAQGPDGAIYISDDYAGAIYRVSYDHE